MAISYEPLEHTLIRLHLNKQRLIDAQIISRATAAKFGRGDYVALQVIDRLCSYLRCRIEDVIEWVPDDTT